LAPDGFSRPVMVVNGQYPGPAIRANWGDTISVTVTNNLSNNGTGIHWHGLRQLNTNQQDGTPGITECPIAPGGSRTYKFQATQYGTSWYHSHYSVQYGDGVSGPIIINGPTTANWDIDLGALPLTDWFHTPIFTLNAREQTSTAPITADNALVNGSMTSSSGGKYSVITLTPGKAHLLRIINTGVNQYFHVGADNHPFTVVAADFTPITPYQATSLVLTIGKGAPSALLDILSFKLLTGSKANDMM
jgi:FtsP/CotA-like multicopper oxidase with cupredoxin domain